MAKGQKAQKKKAGKAKAIAQAYLPREDQFSRFADYVGQLYDPENQSNGELAPSLYPHQGATRSVPFDLTYDAAADGEVLVCKMFPRLTNTLELNHGGVLPVSAAGNSVTFDAEAIIAPNTVLAGVGSVQAHGGVQGATDFELPMITDTVSGNVQPIVEITVAAAMTVPYAIANQGASALRVACSIRDAVTGVWATGTYHAVGVGASVVGGVTTTANGADAVAMIVWNTSTEVRGCKIRMGFNVESSTVTTKALGYSTGDPISHSALTTPQKLDEVRITAMALRITAVGDLTTVAGRAACAIVPRDWLPDVSDPVGSIARLPNNRYVGKLIDGCHIAWQPREPQDFGFFAPEYDPYSHYLIAAVSLTKQTTPVQIQATFDYEIFSNDPNLGAMAWCPSGFGMLEVLQAVFASVSPASENPNHIEKAKKAIAAVRALARRGVNWVMANPALAARIAKTAASLVTGVPIP